MTGRSIDYDLDDANYDPANPGRSFGDWLAKYDAAAVCCGGGNSERRLGIRLPAWRPTPREMFTWPGWTDGSLGGVNGGVQDAWVAKYDAAGHVLWKRQFGTETADDANGVTTDTAGNVYITGDTGFPRAAINTN